MRIRAVVLPSSSAFRSLAVVLLTLGWLTGCHAAPPPGAGAPPPRTAGQPIPGPRSEPAEMRAAVPPPPALSPEACRACGGVWDVHGLSQEKSCDCRTHDGGKRCRDGAECEGVCIAADDPEREVVDAGPPPRGFFVGRCSTLVTVFGCIRPIDRGTVAHGPGLLAEPPPQICVD